MEKIGQRNDRTSDSRRARKRVKRDNLYESLRPSILSNKGNVDPQQVLPGDRPELDKNGLNISSIPSDSPDTQPGVVRQASDPGTDFPV